MANTVTIKLVENGGRNAIIQVYLRSDGSTGELTNQVLLTPTTDLGMLAGHRLRLGRIEYNLAGFDAVIGFGSGTIPVENYKWVITQGTNHPVDFLNWNLMLDDSGLGAPATLLISTTGFTNSNCQGSLLIKCIK